MSILAVRQPVTLWLRSSLATALLVLRTVTEHQWIVVMPKIPVLNHMSVRQFVSHINIPKFPRYSLYSLYSLYSFIYPFQNIGS